jgi:hypothetical protein
LTDEVVSRNSKALLSAAERDNWKAAELLLDHGAEVNWQGEDEKTALFIAVEAGHRAVVEVLDWILPKEMAGRSSMLPWTRITWKLPT